MTDNKETTEAIKPQEPVKRNRAKELEEYEFDKKMLDFVTDEMKQWVYYCFMPLDKRRHVAAVVIKAMQEYEKTKISSSNIIEQSDAIVAMSKQFKM